MKMYLHTSSFERLISLIIGFPDIANDLGRAENPKKKEVR